MSYEPQAGSIPAQVIGYFRLNPEEHLTLDDITTKFQAGRSNIHTLMARALDCDLVKRRKDADGDWLYEAGPQIRPTNLPAFAPVMRGTRRNPIRQAEIDPLALAIVDDPLPASRANPGAKYVPLFLKLKPGQAVRCTPEEVQRVSHAMNKWIAQNKLPYVTRLQRRYHADGQGRVWLLDKPQEQATVKKLRAA